MTNATTTVRVRNAFRATVEGKANRTPSGHKMRTDWAAATVDAVGNVRVYDDVAGHWRVDHYLTAAQVRYVRAKCA